MIENLQKTDIPEAVKVYIEGLRMQIPPGDASSEKISKKLESEVITFVYKENENILGLVSFKTLDKNSIKLDFICAIESGRGIGKSLMKELANYANGNNIKFIYSRASSRDIRTIKFYESCGFEVYGQEKSEESGLVLYKVKLSI